MTRSSTAITCAVSYTHLDVYKRQALKLRCTWLLGPHLGIGLGERGLAEPQMSDDHGLGPGNQADGVPALLEVEEVRVLFIALGIAEEHLSLIHI